MTLHMDLDFHPGNQPPKESGTYLVIIGSGGTIVTMNYSALYGEFNCWDDQSTARYALKVRWWAVLPSWMRWAGGNHPGRG